MVVERAARDQGLSTCVGIGEGPVDAVRERLMLIETLHNVPSVRSHAGVAEAAKPDDLEAVVHAGDEEVGLARGGRMPFHPPRAATDVGMSEW